MNEFATAATTANSISHQQLQTDKHTNAKSARTRQLTAHDYANAVQAHSEQSISDSLYPGHNFANLASYLSEPYQIRAPLIAAQNTVSNQQRNSAGQFASIYRLSKRGDERFRYINSPEELDVLENEIAALTVNPSTGGGPRDNNNISDQNVEQGRLLFLRGNASPEWLNYIGARYSVDPEFFRRHRDFAATMGRPEYFSLPSLPSTNLDMIRLRVTTIGSRIPLERNNGLSQKELDTLRRHAKDSMKDYLNGLSRQRITELRLGDSVVQDFSINSLEHFSIEQNISIYITKAPNGWIAIVWLDVGNSLDASTPGPWNTKPYCTDSSQMEYFPTIQHRSRVALKRHRARQLQEARFSRTSNAEFNDDVQQSASLLHLDYGRKLDHEIMSCDPFYALHDVLRFVAFTTVQLLNLIKSKTRMELEHSALIELKRQTVSNVVYNKRILERHIEYIREILMFIRSRADCDWPRHPDPEKIAHVASRRLVSDFEYLESQAQALVVECDSGIEIIAQNAMTQEAQNALIQAEGVAKLTKLAFIFVPLSFTSSFFGMNIAEFGIGASVTFGTWFATSVPIVLVSFLFMFLDVTKTVKTLPSLFAEHMKRRAMKGVELMKIAESQDIADRV